MERQVYLHSFKPVLPLYHLPQDELVNWTLESHKRCSELLGEETLHLEKLQKYCLSSEQIGERFYECDDVNMKWNEHEIYSLSDESPYGAEIFDRNQFFANRAQDIFSEIYQTEEKPGHLIHVTCTGYVSPSPAQMYFSHQDSAPAISHAYHMGCYASLPSIRLASGIVQGLGEDQVDIVHTEMCSLHMNPSMHNPEQIVVQTLFADGHIKYSAASSAVGPSFQVLKIKEQLVPDSGEDMTWVPSAYGMKMTLSREVPLKIAHVLGKFVKELCEEAGETIEDVVKNGLFAIHPGGPKIIAGVQERLGLSHEQVAASLKVLKERGNMSSATLPHVWNEMMKGELKNDQLVLSLAFGPGLTIFGSLFRVKV